MPKLESFRVSSEPNEPKNEGYELYFQPWEVLMGLRKVYIESWISRNRILNSKSCRFEEKRIATTPSKNQQQEKAPEKNSGNWKTFLLCLLKWQPF